MRRIAMVLVAVVAVGVAGCGGGGGVGGARYGAPAAAGSSGVTTKSASSPTGGGKFCTDAATNQLANQLSAVGASGAQGATALQKELDVFKQYESDAPSAIKSDVKVLVDYYTKYVQILSNDQGNPQKLGTDLQSVTANIQSLTTAAQHISAYYAANCHP